MTKSFDFGHLFMKYVCEKHTLIRKILSAHIFFEQKTYLFNFSSPWLKLYNKYCHNDRPNLPYFEALMAELLRKADIAPFAIFHSCHEEGTIAGYR